MLRLIPQGTARAGRERSRSGRVIEPEDWERRKMDETLGRLIVVGLIALWAWRMRARRHGGSGAGAGATMRAAIPPRSPRPAPPLRGRRDEPPARVRLDLGELARRLAVTPDELRAFRAHYTYREIPKRSGGTRRLAVPDRATRDLQRRILRRLLGKLTVGDAVHGFERGRAPLTNARVHTGSALVLRLDLIDFFGRTRSARVRRYLRVLGWDREAARVLVRLVTHEGGLPQGAPTSPRLANLVNASLDARLTGLARVEGARYTRYADDLVFSFERDDPDALRRLRIAAGRIVADHGYALRPDKTRVRRRHQRQLVTGLVVNGERPRLPRETRRLLRALAHHRARGDELLQGDAVYAGLLAHARSIESPPAAEPDAP